MTASEEPVVSAEHDTLAREFWEASEAAADDGPMRRDDGLLAQLIEHIMTDRSHMHCPMRAVIEAHQTA